MIRNKFYARNLFGKNLSTSSIIFTINAGQAVESATNFKIQEYDLLTLSQTWPQTGCWDWNKKWPTGEASCSVCKLPNDKNSWTLHGLWPSNRNGKHPFNCNKIPYNPKLINNGLRTQLEQKWPTVKLGMKNDDFWKHEWTKHGTCAMDLEETNSLPKYFSKALQLLDQYNLGKVLRKSGIMPGKKYSFKSIIQAIDNDLEVKTHIKCAKKPNGTDQYLNEITVCFNKLFQLTDCQKKDTSNCNANNPIFYPVNLKSCS